MTPTLIPICSATGGHREPPGDQEGADAQLHADQEQQQQHAELRQGADLLAPRDDADTARSEDDSGENVTDQRRLTQARDRHAA